MMAGEPVMASTTLLTTLANVFRLFTRYVAVSTP